MAKPKTVRGTLSNGAVVETSEENAVRLGSGFTPEKKRTTRQTAKADDKADVTTTTDDK